MRCASLLAAAASLALTGCGLRPLYAGGGGGPVAQTLRSVDVAPIEGRAGWLVRTALQDRLGGSQGGGSRYRLVVRLDDSIIGFGIRPDDSETRERRTLRARYQLVEAETGTVVLDATAGSDAGIDVVSSDYANVAAEQTALERLSQEVADQIVTRLALYVRRGGPSAQPGAGPSTPLPTGSEQR
jgi:LPS-assembly lipoprotein